MVGAATAQWEQGVVAKQHMVAVSSSKHQPTADVHVFCKNAVK